MKTCQATYIDPYSQQNILLMSLGLHGSKGGAAWEEADVADFLKELVTLKYFEGMETIESRHLSTQALLTRQSRQSRQDDGLFRPSDPRRTSMCNMYSLANIEEGICRHPELIVALVQAFEWKFHPAKHRPRKVYDSARDAFSQARRKSRYRTMR